MRTTWADLDDPRDAWAREQREALDHARSADEHRPHPPSCTCRECGLEEL